MANSMCAMSYTVAIHNCPKKDVDCGHAFTLAHFKLPGGESNVSAIFAGPVP